MSQVVSVKLPARFEEACNEFRRIANVPDTKNTSKWDEKNFLITCDKDAGEIICEGDFPDGVFAALENVKEKYGGKLFYEDQAWSTDHEEVGEASMFEKLQIILAIVFFPVTLLYLLVKTFVWLPFKIWKMTR